MTNGLNTPVGKEYLNNLYSEEKAKTDIESVRDKVDFVIVAMHWGTEYSFNVDNKQEEIANMINRSLRTVKTRMNQMQEKGLIARKNGKRNGEWIILLR